jgi:hypothetical protein
MRDTSPDAFTPTLGFATTGRVVHRARLLPADRFVFWLASLHDKKDWTAADASPSACGHGRGGGLMRVPLIPRLAALVWRRRRSTPTSASWSRRKRSIPPVEVV